MLKNNHGFQDKQTLEHDFSKKEDSETVKKMKDL